MAIVGDDVFVEARPPRPVAERWERRLRDGLEHDLTLVLAKSVQALLELPDGQDRILRIAYEFGDRNRAEGWGSGMTVLTCMANLLPHLAADDRPLAMVHAIALPRRRCPRSCPHGSRNRRSVRPANRPNGWPSGIGGSSRPVSADGAERALITAIGQSDLGEVEQFMFAAATDHVYLDGGHTLDFTNKAFEAIGHLGDGSGAMLTSLVAQTCAAERAEESSEWNHPIDLRSLADLTEVELCVALAVGGNAGNADTGTGIDVGALGWIAARRRAPSRDEALVAAACAGGTAEELARAVALAAALRLVRFHLNNDPGDWDTVHHTFTYANAVHQAVVRQAVRAGASDMRGIVHGALRVYLDRFLNVPAARLPTSTSATLDDARVVLATCKAQVDAAGDAVAGFLRGGGSRAELVAALGHALLQEDAGFHWYQSIEAGVRQSSAWPEGSEEALLVLVGVARFLAAHTPTRRELRDDLAHGRPVAARRRPLRRRVTPAARRFGPDARGHARVAAVSDPK